MRRLSAEEEALWARVVRTVRPLREEAEARAADSRPEPSSPPPKPSFRPDDAPRAKTARRQPPPPAPDRRTLDSHWDRRLARGAAAPDFTVDLHGLGQAEAYEAIDRRLELAVETGARLVLLVTGRPPSPDRPGRGAIRAAVGDWLAASRHARSIAAVRGAHPRHGGAGALYIVLKRKR